MHRHLAAWCTTLMAEHHTILPTVGSSDRVGVARHNGTSVRIAPPGRIHSSSGESRGMKDSFQSSLSPLNCGIVAYSNNTIGRPGSSYSTMVFTKVLAGKGQLHIYFFDGHRRSNSSMSSNTKKYLVPLKVKSTDGHTPQAGLA